MHRQAVGTTKIVSADAKGVTLRLFLKNAYRNLYVHALASASRDRWLASLSNGHATQLIEAEATKITHTIKKAESFPAEVPAPRPIDDKAGQTFDVTPALAAKWLERNTRNRPLRDAVVLKYASDMRDGKWKVTGDAIAFDKNGAVVNGQHRLWAVLESGKTICMLVVFDLDPDVVYVLDDHFKRKLVDIIHIAQPGCNIQTKHTAIARAMMFPVTAIDQRGIFARASRQHQVDFLNKHLDAIQFVVSDCFHGKNTRSLTNSNILAGVARAYYSQDKERLKHFGRVLISGIMEDKSDKAAILLRNWMLGLETKNIRADADVIKAKAQRAIYGFLHGETSRSITAVSEELFPLPEEQGPGGKMMKRRMPRIKK